MILRDYQERMVKTSVQALQDKGNTLAVAPTGAGKTIILSAVAGKLGGKQCVLQHRDELVTQNSQKFKLVNPDTSIGLVNAAVKDWRGQATFAMVQTLVRNLGSMPALDALIIDEAHHAVADTYRRVVDRALNLNPKCKIYGVTATPARGDKKGLRPVFDNCCDIISLHTLIQKGHLVPPRMFSLTLGSETDMKLAALRKTAGGEFDMEEADAALNTVANNETVIQEWKRLAANRKTIVFCSTVRHAQAVRDAFLAAGIRAAMVDGATREDERRKTLADFDRQGPNSIQVLCNVAVLTEGFDSQPVSCVVLLRPCSQKPTMIQMIGRGLRKVEDMEKYPGVIKKDCLVLDFGNSLDTHGTDLSMGVRLDDAPVWCRGCGSEIPRGANPCPICGMDRTPEEGSGGGGSGDPEQIGGGELTELEFFQDSPFNWCDIFGSGKVMMASGFECFCAVVSADGENWLALGRENEDRAMKVIGSGERISCLASADDFFRMREDSDAVKKNKRWMKDVCTDKQWGHLKNFGYPDEERLVFTKYGAACALNFFWNQGRIERAMRRELGCF